MKVLYISSLLLLLVELCFAGHSFKGTDVVEYDQQNFAIETGIGLGKKNIKGDYFVMFYASWCPHCQNFMPTWLKLKDNYSNDNIVAVHCPDNHDLCESFKVQGYPTLLLFSENKYQYCQFTEKRDYESVEIFWKNKCKGNDMFDITFTVDVQDAEDDEELEEQEMKDLGGDPIKKTKNDEKLDEEESKKDKKNFRAQKNRAYEDKILKFKDYMKKLGPLTIVALIGLCILSVTFICNKCCSYDQEDPFTKRVIKSVEKKTKGGYTSTKNNDRSSYVL